MGRNGFVSALRLCGLSVAAVAFTCMCACSANVYLGGPKTAHKGADTPSEVTDGAGESMASSTSDDGQRPSDSPRRSTSGDRTYIDGQSPMRSPSSRLPDGGDGSQSSADEWQESPLLAKRHYPIPNYADPANDAGVLPHTVYEGNESPSYYAATTIPAPSGLIVVLGAIVRRSRRRSS